MRFHLLALPNVQTTRAFVLDGFCTTTIRMARLLKSIGHDVILYASEENEAPCDELVTVITKAEQAAFLDGMPYQYAALDNRAAPLWMLANRRIAAAIAERKRPHDFILTIGGTSQQQIAELHPDLMCVEYSIGYISSFAPYRVFQSNQWRSFTHGMQGPNYDGRIFDHVIPLFFDPAEFQYRAKVDGEPFALYVGRLIPKKGIEIACKACEAAGIRLKVIGHGDPSLVTNGAEYLGALGMEERNEYQSRAGVVFCPTTYIEPFGATAIEAQLCGTPVISSDFGAFVETVEHGKSGFRCHLLRDYVEAIPAALALDREYIKNRACAHYSIAAAGQQYAAYFARLLTLWDRGFYTL
jgi:glycosyltransferase involved in cell wall biosynthesis